MFRRSTKKDKIFNGVLMVIMGAIAVLFLIPLIHVLACSFSSADQVVAGNVGLLPIDFTLDGYKQVFSEESFSRGFLNTLFYTALGTVIKVTLQLLCAYHLSRRDFKGRKILNIFLVLTMFVSGGMIPTYLLISQLHMINTIWAILIPGCVSVFNIIVIRTYIESSIPNEIQEAAKIDGCGDFAIFLKIIIPLSRPIIAVMILYAVVGYWNNYFNALLYVQDTSLFPLQKVLQDLLITNQKIINRFKQIEQVSDGGIKKSSVLLTLSIGVGVAIGLCAIRAIYKFSIAYYIIPGYLIALGLTFFSPNLFTALAFDSGGVASGPMTVSFLLPLTIGMYASQNNIVISNDNQDGLLKQDVLTNCFGVIAMVAMTPLIAIQILGIIIEYKKYRRQSLYQSQLLLSDNEVIHF